MLRHSSGRSCGKLVLLRFLLVLFLASIKSSTHLLCRATIVLGASGVQSSGGGHSNLLKKDPSTFHCSTCDDNNIATMLAFARQNISGDKTTYMEGFYHELVRFKSECGSELERLSGLLNSSSSDTTQCDQQLTDKKRELSELKQVYEKALKDRDLKFEELNVEARNALKENEAFHIEERKKWKEQLLSKVQESCNGNDNNDNNDSKNNGAKSGNINVEDDIRTGNKNSSSTSTSSSWSKLLLSNPTMLIAAAISTVALGVLAGTIAASVKNNTTFELQEATAACEELKNELDSLNDSIRRKEEAWIEEQRVWEQQQQQQIESHMDAASTIQRLQEQHAQEVDSVTTRLELQADMRVQEAEKRAAELEAEHRLVKQEAAKHTLEKDAAEQLKQQLLTNKENFERAMQQQAVTLNEAARLSAEQYESDLELALKLRQQEAVLQEAMDKSTAESVAAAEKLKSQHCEELTEKLKSMRKEHADNLSVVEHRAADSLTVVKENHNLELQRILSEKALELRRQAERFENQIVALKSDHVGELARLARAADALAADHKLQIDILTRGHEGQLDSLRTAHESELQRLNSERVAEWARFVQFNQERLDTLGAGHQTELNRLVEEHTAEVSRLARAAEIQGTDTAAAQNIEIDRLKSALLSDNLHCQQAHQDALDQINSLIQKVTLEHSAEIQRLASAADLQLQNMQNQHALELQRSLQSSESQIETLNSQLDMHLQQLNTNHSSEIARVSREAESQRAMQRTQHEMALQRLTAAHAAEVSRLEHVAQAQVEAAQSQACTDIQHLRDSNSAELDRISTTTCKEQIEILKQEHRTTLQSLSAEHDSEVMRLKGAYDAQVEFMNLDHKDQLQAVRSDHTAELERLSRAADVHLRELSSAHAVEIERLGLMLEGQSLDHGANLKQLNSAFESHLLTLNRHHALVVAQEQTRQREELQRMETISNRETSHVSETARAEISALQSNHAIEIERLSFVQEQRDAEYRAALAELREAQKSEVLRLEAMHVISSQEVLADKQQHMAQQVERLAASFDCKLSAQEEKYEQREQTLLERHRMALLDAEERYRADRASFAAAHKAELERLSAEHTAEIDRIVTAAAAATAESSRVSDTQTLELELELERCKSELRGVELQRAKERETHQLALTAHEQELYNQSKVHMAELESAKIAAAIQCASSQSAHDKQLQAITAEHSAELAQLALANESLVRDHRDALRHCKEEEENAAKDNYQRILSLETQLQDVKTENDLAVLRRNEAHTCEIERLFRVGEAATSQHSAEVQRLSDLHAAETQRLKGACEHQVHFMNEDHKSQMNYLLDAHATDLKKMQESAAATAASHDAELRNIHAEHSAELSRLNASTTAGQQVQVEEHERAYIVLNNALDALRCDHKAELMRLAATHRLEIGRLGETIAELRIAHQRDMDALKTQHSVDSARYEQEKEEQVVQYEAALTSLRVQHETEKDISTAVHSKQLRAAEEEHEQTRCHLSSKHEDELARLQQGTAAQLAELKAAHASELTRMATEYADNELSRLKNSAADTAASEALSGALESQMASLRKHIDQLESSWETRMAAAVTAAHSSELERATAQHADEVKRLITALSHAKEETNAAVVLHTARYEEQRTSLCVKQEAEVARLKEEIVKWKVALQQREQEEANQVGVEHAEQLSRVKAACKERIDALRAEHDTHLQAVRSDHTAELERLSRATDVHLRELSSAHAVEIERLGLMLEGQSLDHGADLKQLNSAFESRHIDEVRSLRGIIDDVHLLLVSAADKHKEAAEGDVQQMKDMLQSEAEAEIATESARLQANAELELMAVKIAHEQEVETLKAQIELLRIQAVSDSDGNGEDGSGSGASSMHSVGHSSNGHLLQQQQYPGPMPHLIPGDDRSSFFEIDYENDPSPRASRNRGGAARELEDAVLAAAAAEEMNAWRLEQQQKFAAERAAAKLVAEKILVDERAAHAAALRTARLEAVELHKLEVYRMEADQRDEIRAAVEAARSAASEAFNEEKRKLIEQQQKLRATLEATHFMGNRLLQAEADACLQRALEERRVQYERALELEREAAVEEYKMQLEEARHMAAADKESSRENMWYQQNCREKEEALDSELERVLFADDESIAKAVQGAVARLNLANSRGEIIASFVEDGDYESSSDDEEEEGGNKNGNKNGNNDVNRVSICRNSIDGTTSSSAGDISITDNSVLSECSSNTASPRKTSLLSRKGSSAKDRWEMLRKTFTVAEKVQMMEDIERSLAGEEIHFEVDEADLTEAGKKQLDKIMPFLLKHPSAVICVEGHTDCMQVAPHTPGKVRVNSIGNIIANSKPPKIIPCAEVGRCRLQQLSLARTETVSNYFTTWGCTNEFQCSGHGCQHPELKNKRMVRIFPK